MIVLVVPVAVALVIGVLIWRARSLAFTTISYGGLRTGDGPLRVSNSGDALPSGLRVDADYWVKGTSDNFRLVRRPLKRIARTLRTLIGKVSQ